MQIEKQIAGAVAKLNHEQTDPAIGIYSLPYNSANAKKERKPFSGICRLYFKN